VTRAESHQGIPRQSKILIHVGLHKCASTWLQRNVFERDDLGFYSPWGAMSAHAVSEFVGVDPLCFAPESARERLTSMIGPDLPQGSVLVLSHEALSSRPHHGRYYASSVSARLKAVFPEARLFLMVREQKSLIRSLYVEHVRNGGRDTFAEFIGSGHEPPGFSPKCKLSFFQFDRLVAHYREVFGEENVLVLPLEMLGADPNRFVEKLTGFVGVSFAEIPTGTKANEGWSPTATEYFRITNAFFRTNPIGPSPKFGYRFRQRVVSKVDKMLPGGLTERAASRQKDLLASRVGDFFRASNTALSEMIDVDLKELGYDT
jgi:hypothetical protein